MGREEYTAEISRTNPTCFLFLVDQSGSMADPFGADRTKKKAEGVAVALNKLIQTLVFRCAKGDSILDRFRVGVIGYGKSVGSALGGELAGQGLIPVSEIANHPLRIDTRVRKVDDGAGGLVEQTVKFPVWFDPVALGPTPMREALSMAGEVIEPFVSHYAHCFPPIIINISDGEATGDDPEPAAKALCDIRSSDGSVLLFNVHISDKNVTPIQYPATDAGLPDDHSRKLFRMSSPLPPVMQEYARATELPITQGARGFVFNGDLVAVIQLLDIGTRVER